ncbi:hypothetical protein I4U23_023612 [Adineta vaga]|nr:hypothetical protein I4U23_023612 [Adineta vaga]
MLTSNNHVIAILDCIAFWINRLSPIITIIFGTFGNFCNIIIFTRPALRTNPCSLYFLAGSLANLLVIYVALLTRYLATSWAYDPSATSMIWCKTRHILVYPSLSLVLWFIVLASIDRYLSSSRNIRFRQLSTVSVAWKIILITTLLTFLSNIHVLVFARAEPINGISTCTILPNEYLIFFNIFVPIVSCILPIILMGTFGILTILNVRLIRKRIIPQENNRRNERLRSNDRQLVIMLLCQVLITTIIVAPWALINMFSAIGVTILKYTFSTMNQAIYNFAFNVSRMLYYMNPAVSFYIYTLSGPKFRLEIKQFILYGFKIILTATCIMRCLPMRLQQGLNAENGIDSINNSFTKTRKACTTHVNHH